MSQRTRNLRPKTENADVARSICPYCGVGCGQLVYHRNGKLIAIEGDPQSPISRGHLCPKGADTFELHTHPARLKKVKYRAPYSRQWQEIDLERAMEMVADRVWDTRDRTFQRRRRDSRSNGASENRALQALGIGAAIFETFEGFRIEARLHAELEPLKQGVSGWITTAKR